jgi:Domain of unknown function (DUF4082)/Immunoglobulin domain/FG-GAP-like repeat
MDTSFLHRVLSVLAVLGVMLFANSTAQGATGSVVVGQSVTFSVTANGTVPFTYQWYKNSAAIAGATAATCSISSVQTSDAGSYSATVSNSAGSTSSDTATLVVNPAAVAPTITTQPASQTVVAGASVTFTAAASGTPAPTYQWQKNGANISGCTSASYTIASVATGNAGTYTMVATNSAGSATSSGAVLTVNPATVAPKITTQPVSQTVVVGASVTFTAAASGAPAPSYQWQKNGANIAGCTSASYTISSVATGNAGTYTMVATNSAGSATSNGAVLTVNPATVAPTITAQPVSQTVMTGSSVTFSVTATGVPAPTYQWRKGSRNISGATASSYTIAAVSSANAATYTVVVKNSSGSVTSNGAVLTVKAATAAPTITTQPVSQTAVTGASVTFTAAASGTPAPTYQWQKNGANISGATSASYTIANVATGNAGTYTMVATNSAGSATSNGAVLTVNAATVAPTITTQPASQTVVPGASATFTAAASGTPAPTYQWQFNGAKITGATSASYTIASAAAGNAGTYTMVATNSAGSATSSGAVLTVNAATTGQALTIWQSTAVPALADGGADSPVELGVKFRSDTAGSIVGIRFYKALKNTGTHIGNLWSSNGTLLASATFSGESASGWQQVTFATAVSIAANTVYVASYHCAGGHYSADVNYFASSGVDNPPLHALANGVSGPDSVYSYGTTSVFPVQTWNTSNYWVDVAFVQNAATETSAAVSAESVAALPLMATGSSLDGTTQGVAAQAAGISLNSSLAAASTTGVATGSTAGKPSVPADFNGDGFADLLWQNLGTGETKIWFMNGVTKAGETSLGNNPNAGWTFPGTGDFNGDGKTDVLWQNTNTGACGIELLDGTVSIGSVGLPAVSAGWRIAGTGDFNGDGKTDILWQNIVTGEISVWFMNGTKYGSVASLGTVSLDWRIAGTADFNGDGNVDILWQNKVTGEVSIWLMNGTTCTSVVSLGCVSLDWQIAGAADFDLDGHPDIVWQNVVSGDRGIRLMNGTTCLGWVDLGTVPIQWSIVGGM